MSNAVHSTASRPSNRLAARRCPPALWPAVGAAAFAVGEWVRSSGLLAVPFGQLGLPLVESPLRPLAAFAGDPGAIVSPAMAEDFAHKLHDCRLVKLGAGIHYLQEDHPETIGRSVAEFIGEIEARAGKG